MRAHCTIVAMIAAVAALASAGTAGASPPPGPSCNGWLASFANPNNAFIIHELVKPAAEALGITQGALLSQFAHEHSADLESCIPE